MKIEYVRIRARCESCQQRLYYGSTEHYCKKCISGWDEQVALRMVLHPLHETFPHPRDCRIIRGFNMQQACEEEIWLS